MTADYTAIPAFVLLALILKGMQLKVLKAVLSRSFKQGGLDCYSWLSLWKLACMVALIL